MKSQVLWLDSRFHQLIWNKTTRISQHIWKFQNNVSKVILLSLGLGVIVLGRAWMIGQRCLFHGCDQWLQQIRWSYPALRAEKVMEFKEGKGLRPNILHVTHGFQWDYGGMKIDHIYPNTSPCWYNLSSVRERLLWQCWDFKYKGICPWEYKQGRRKKVK